MFNILTCAVLAWYMWLTAVIIGFPQVSSSNQKVVSPFHLWISWEPTPPQLPPAHWVNGGAERGLMLVPRRWLGVLVYACASERAWSCWEKLPQAKNLPHVFSEIAKAEWNMFDSSNLFWGISELLVVIAWAGTRCFVPCEWRTMEGLFLLVGKWGKGPVYAVPQLKVSLMAKPNNSNTNVFQRGFKPLSLMPWVAELQPVCKHPWMSASSLLCPGLSTADIRGYLHWWLELALASLQCDYQQSSVHPLWGTKHLVWAHKADYSI